ncbi:MAG TPA: hypothetical protein VGL53_01835 [Bryobacteraceae bacterium]|jgi:hypothetical protein
MTEKVRLLSPVEMSEQIIHRSHTMQVQAGTVYKDESSQTILDSYLSTGTRFFGGLAQAIRANTRSHIPDGNDFYLSDVRDLVLIGGRNSIRQEFASVGPKLIYAQPGEHLYLSSLQEGASVGRVMATVGASSFRGGFAAFQGAFGYAQSEGRGTGRALSAQTKKLTLVRLSSAPFAPHGSVQLQSQETCASIAVQIAIMFHI